MIPAMAELPLLAQPEEYRAATIDLMGDAEARRYWIEVFVNHLPSLRRHALESEGDRPEKQQRIDAVAAAFEAKLDRVREEPAAYGELSIIRLCELREQSLRDHDIADPYRPVKHRENEQAIELLPDRLAHLDAMAEDERLESLIRGVFAGNVFDLGAVSTLTMYEQGEVGFEKTEANLPDRPWLFDDFDALRARWREGPHRKAVLLVDNAGADVVLGMIPLGRELLRRGAAVILSANSTPALNDITHEELIELLAKIAGLDEVIREGLADGRLRTVASGNGTPLIDLKRISEALAAEAADADLLVLEGMGRALETNLYTPFTCESLKLAMVKEGHVAEVLGGQLYDVVCRYERPGRV